MQINIIKKYRQFVGHTQDLRIDLWLQMGASLRYNFRQLSADLYTPIEGLHLLMYNALQRYEKYI